MVHYNQSHQGGWRASCGRGKMHGSHGSCYYLKKSRRKCSWRCGAQVKSPPFRRNNIFILLRMFIAFSKRQIFNLTVKKRVHCPQNTSETIYCAPLHTEWGGDGNSDEEKWAYILKLAFITFHLSFSVGDFNKHEIMFCAHFWYGSTATEHETG